MDGAPDVGNADGAGDVGVAWRCVAMQILYLSINVGMHARIRTCIHFGVCARARTHVDMQADRQAGRRVSMCAYVRLCARAHACVHAGGPAGVMRAV